MSSLNVFQAAMDMNGPPGLVHPLLVENFAWVDERLREMYNGYALTDSNCDEYEAAGLLKENWAWVDRRLEEMCNQKEKKRPFPLCPLPITWGYPRPCDRLECIEDDESSVESCIGHKRKRSESDLSDHKVEAGRATKRLHCQSPILTGKYLFELSNQFCEGYSYDAESVSSLDLGSLHIVSDDEETYYDDYDCDGYDSL
jgi:hypothetical protein